MPSAARLFSTTQAHRDDDPKKDTTEKTYISIPDKPIEVPMAPFTPFADHDPPETNKGDDERRRLDEPPAFDRLAVLREENDLIDENLFFEPPYQYLREFRKGGIEFGPEGLRRGDKQSEDDSIEQDVVAEENMNIPMEDKADIDDISSSTPISSSSLKRPLSFTHLNPSGHAHMVDISHKTPTPRLARAVAIVLFSHPLPLRLLLSKSIPKGDALAIARLSGLSGVKKTSDLIYLSHPSLAIEHCSLNTEIIPIKALDYTTRDARKGSIRKSITSPVAPFGGVRLTSTVKCSGKTGVEMEALTSVMIAALNFVDMVKGVDKGVSVSEVRVIEKRGGKSGGWVWSEERGALERVVDGKGEREGMEGGGRGGERG